MFSPLVREAFHLFWEVHYNGIHYLKEEKIKSRNALEGANFELYFRGMKRFRGKPSVTNYQLEKLLRKIERIQ